MSLHYFPFILGFSDYIIWQQKGEQGPGWVNGQAPITQTKHSYVIVFEGKRGTSYQGDIAIDDITFTESFCGG